MCVIDLSFLCPAGRCLGAAMFRRAHLSDKPEYSEICRTGMKSSKRHPRLVRTTTFDYQCTLISYRIACTAKPLLRWSWEEEVEGGGGAKQIH